MGGVIKLASRKKPRKYTGKKSIVYITLIISISAMGVGYAAWSDGLTIENKITTGELINTFVVKERDLKLDDCASLSMELVDDSTLKIKGDIYPTFDNNFPIVIENKGTIPAKLTELKIEDKKEISKPQDLSISKNRFTSISKLSSNNSDIDMDILIDPEDEVKPFTINISAIDVEADNKDMLKASSARTNKLDLSNDEGGEIGRLRNRIRQLENEIRDLEEEIREYEKEEDYDFNYKMLIEQGL